MNWNKIIGYLFILFGIVGIIINLYLGSLYNIIWLSNHLSLVLGVAFLYKSRVWISAELSIALIPELLWSIDFLGKLITGEFILGTTEYMFNINYSPLLYYLSLSHLFVAPIALVVLWYLGGAVKAWKQACMHGVVLLFFSFAFMNGHNLNCFRESCVPFITVSGITYQVLWPILFFIFVVIPMNWLLVQWIKKR